MMIKKSVSFFSCFFFLSFIGPLSVSAWSGPCGVGDEQADSLRNVPTFGTVRVDPSTIAQFNTVFPLIFDLYVDEDWNLANPLGDDWGWSDVEEFVDAVIHEDSQVGDQIAHKVADYFSVDQTTGVHSSIQIGNQTYYTIVVKDSNAYSYGYVDGVLLNIQNRWEETQEPLVVARGIFAHEWQHTCYHHWTDYQALPILSGHYNSTEFFSKFAEYYCNPGFSDRYFDFAMAEGMLSRTGSYIAHCMNDGSSTPHPYRAYVLLSAYLHDKFSGDPQDPTDDFIYRWIRTPFNIDGDTVLAHKHRGMAALLAGSEFNSFFTSPEGDNVGRYGEVLDGLLLASIMNIQDEPLPDPLLRWVEGTSPQEKVGYLTDSDGWDYNHPQTYPFLMTASADPVVLPLEVTYENYGYTPNFPSWDVSRRDLVHPIGLQPYMFQYFAFTSDELTSDNTLCLDLRIANKYTCGGWEDYWDAQSSHGLGGVDLRGFAIGIPEILTGTEYEFMIGEPDIAKMAYTGEVIGEFNFSSPYPGEMIQFRAESIGMTYEAVIVALTCYPHYPDDTTFVQGLDWYPYLPIEVTYYIDNGSITPKSGSITGTVHWPDPGEDTVYVDGDIIIKPGASLILDPGCKVNIIDEDVSITVGGSLIAEGTELDPIVLRNYAYETSVESWSGIYIADGSTVSFENVVCRGAEYIHETGRDVASSVEFGTGTVVYGGDIHLDGNTLSLEGAHFLGIDRMKMSSSCSIDDCVIRQRFSKSSLPVIIPAVVFETGVVSIQNTPIEYEDVGIYVSGSSTIADIGPYVWLRNRTGYGLGHGTGNGIAIECRDLAQVEVNMMAVDTHFDEFQSGNESNGPGVGIDVAGGATVKVRHSQFRNILSIGVKVAANAGAIDLGTSAQDLGENNFTSKLNLCGYLVPPDCWVIPSFEVNGYLANYSSTPIAAQGNYWEHILYDCTDCLNRYFYGAEDLSNYSETPIPWDDSLYPEFLLVPIENPLATELRANPNPFNPSISFSIGGQQWGPNAEVRIFSISGRQVFTSELPEAATIFEWNGKSLEGHEVSSGVYLAKLLRENQSPKTSKIVLIR
jgi:hypothetical protein